MAINFPLSPTVGQTYTFGNQSWSWSGTTWDNIPFVASDTSINTSTYRSGLDGNGIYTVITYKRADGTNYKVSTLSGGTSPTYTTRTVVNYGADGTTVTSTQVYTLTYADGVNLSQEVLN